MLLLFISLLSLLFYFKEYSFLLSVENILEVLIIPPLLELDLLLLLFSFFSLDIIPLEVINVPQTLYVLMEKTY